MLKSTASVFGRSMLKMDLQEVSTPQIMSDALWRTSGHWDHYRDNMYFTEKEDQQFAVKPNELPRPHNYIQVIIGKLIIDLR